ncbi:MAG TPA: cupin domain-containing protein [Solirubrobacteraceae bacterium]|jgi:quercetin dioxygenase-like cupin family protein|nr:cupin domain-containing protein [Solirubrobacteraceae bacterium]
MAGARHIRVCGDGPELDLVRGDGGAWALVHPGVGATLRAMHRVTLGEDAETITLSHPSDAVYYVLDGDGSVAADGDDGRGLAEGVMVHIDAGTRYRLRAGTGGMTLVGGPAPVDVALYADGAPTEAERTADAPSRSVRLFHRDRPDLLMPPISSDARLVVWPGVGAFSANMNYVRMQPGEENVPHVHPLSEDTIYIVEGRGSVRNVDDDTVQQFGPGQAIFVPAGVCHQVRADAGVPVVSVGGPCPPDYEMLRRLGAEFATP